MNVQTHITPDVCYLLGRSRQSIGSRIDRGTWKGSRDRSGKRVFHCTELRRILLELDDIIGALPESALGQARREYIEKVDFYVSRNGD